MRCPIWNIVFTGYVGVEENLTHLFAHYTFTTSPLYLLLQSYMNPLTELAKGPSPILDSDQVEHLFGPIAQVRVMYTTTLCIV